MEADIWYKTAIFKATFIYTFHKFKALTTICVHVLSESSVDWMRNYIIHMDMDTNRYVRVDVV
jgi:hypothetical protein